MRTASWQKKPPLMPCKPFYNLHYMHRWVASCQPSLLPTSGAKNLREACNQLAEIGIPYNYCGFKKTYHEHSREFHIQFYFPSEGKKGVTCRRVKIINLPLLRRRRPPSPRKDGAYIPHMPCPLPHPPGFPGTILRPRLRSVSI